MKILVQPATRKCSSDSCNYTCPVYNTGAEGLEKLIKKLAKKIHKGENHRGKVCWYGN